MSHSRCSFADRALLADNLRERSSYAAAKEVLEGACQASRERQFEILLAACGLLDGRPVLCEITEDHLAIVLLLAEWQEHRRGELVARLDVLARSFACPSFAAFDERRHALWGGDEGVSSFAPVAPPKTKSPSSGRKSRTVERAELVGWVLALTMLLAMLVGAVLSSSLGDRATPTEYSALKPVLDLTASPPVETTSSNVTPPPADLLVLEDLPTEQPAPPNGSVLLFTSAPGVAPLTIAAPAGHHYLVRLRDWHSSAVLMTIFVRGGQTAKVNVPAGEYRLRYVTGRRWFGYENRFGPTEVCFEARQKFAFRDEDDPTGGHTFTLSGPAEPNHRVREISRDEL